MRNLLPLLLLSPGCAAWVWNGQRVDCSDADEIFIEAVDLRVVTGNPQRSDTCALELSGLGQADVERDPDKVRVSDAGEVVLLQFAQRPSTTLVWTGSADLDIDREDFVLELDTDRGQSSGHVLFSTPEEPVLVNIRRGPLDDLEVVTEGDVELFLPTDDTYRFDIQNAGQVQLNAFSHDPNGTRIYVDTPGYVWVEEAIEDLPRD